MWEQQAFVLDSKFNAYRASYHPNFRTLYIRRRSQLLREKSKQDDLTLGNNIRRRYLRIRSAILKNRYNIQFDIQSNSACSQSTSLISLNKDKLETDLLPRNYGFLLTPIPTTQAQASRAIVGNSTMEENYAFNNVHHIYDQHSDAVTILKFANNDKSKLCCASNDGTLSICDVLTTPPCVKAILKCHTGPVTGCDWSASDELIASCSSDATICFWDAIRHCCLRCVSDPFYSSVLVCVFNPVNNNILLTGNKAGFVCVLNVSTGMYPKGGKLKIGGQILSVAVDSSGQIVWAGNDKGEIISLKLNSSDSSVLTKCHRILTSPNRGAITCLSWRSWISREARDPMLLANCANNILCLYKVSENDGGSLCLKKKFLVPHAHSNHLLQSTFCPIMSFRQGACVVTSSEDSCVYFVDVERESNYAVNKLQGHACATLGVTFNYDETFLATSDVQGIIIIWSRQCEKLSSLILVTLNFLATGSYQSPTGNSMFIMLSQPSVSRCISEVVEALNQPEIFEKWVKFPSNLNELTEICNAFYRETEFPGVIGCIDCTHVAIAPSSNNLNLNENKNSEYIYVNRKGYHSINVQLVILDIPYVNGF